MSYNILLVDDSATTRAVMAKAFRLAGVPIGELLQAANGRDALDLLRGHWVDIVFCDLNMPVMNGVELVEQMSRDGLLQMIPVVLVTIEGSATRIDQLKAKGVSSVIRKPFTPETIRSVLGEVLRPRQFTPSSESIREVFSRVLEQFAFMFCDVVDGKNPPSAAGAFRRVAIGFSGIISGNVALAVPERMCTEVSANVLGVEPEDEQAVRGGVDALKELINVFCGQLLTAVAGEEPVFDRTVPEVQDLDQAGWSAMAAQAETHLFVVDDYPVLVELKLAERARLQGGGSGVSDAQR